MTNRERVLQLLADPRYVDLAEEAQTRLDLSEEGDLADGLWDVDRDLDASGHTGRMRRLLDDFFIEVGFAEDVTDDELVVVMGSRRVMKRGDRRYEYTNSWYLWIAE